MRVIGSLISMLGDELTVSLEEGSKIGILKRLLLGRVDMRALKEQEEVGEGRPLVILLNGMNIETLRGEETELRDGDTVILLSPFAGG